MSKGPFSPKKDYSKEALRAVAEHLDKLANGDSVILGEFGDGVNSQPADVEAELLREIADFLRRQTLTDSELAARAEWHKRWRKKTP